MNETENHASDEDDCILPDEEGGLMVDGIYIPPPTKPYCELERKGPRLIITKIINNFFKSYASHVQLGPFHHSFNAIVGPNGSGKSNVIDSMLFVFGYKASRLRCKKLSVLIHNCSAHQNVTSCSVSVHFALIEDEDNGAGDIIPNSEFVISRTAFKDNSSYYEYNGNKVQFRDVAVVLKKYGIDLIYNRFLILQGEVEDIAMMKPKAATEHDTGMLEYLEDIIGTTRFKKPLTQLDQRVNKLTEQLGSKLNRLQLIQAQIEDMKPSMAEAVKFLTFENMITKCNNIICQKKLYDLKETSNNLDAELEESKETRFRIDDTIKSIGNELASIESKCTEAAASYNSLIKHIELVKVAQDNATKKDTEVKDEMIEINKTRKKNIALMAEEVEKLKQFETVPERNQEILVQCRSRLEQVQQKKSNLDEEKLKIQESLKGLTTDLQNERESIQADLNKLMKNVNETEAAYKLADSKLKLYTESDDKNKEILNNLELNLGETRTKIQEYDQELISLKKKIPLTEKSLLEATKELQMTKTREDKLMQTINKEKRHLEEIRASMVASKSKSRVLDALMQQKREGKCPGLYGRLGDLGAIDLKYDVAVSTACGPLDHIVVDTVETAIWCIEFLKKNDIGRAAIIALEKQQNLWSYINEPIRTPEDLPRLFDLIRVENEDLKPAFYYGLRDTLVANNLDQATRVAYGRERFRVVTLNGELIELTGTMSGGGNRVSRGRMGQSIVNAETNPQEIERIEAEVESKEQELRACNTKQSTLDNQISALDNELSRMKLAGEKLVLQEKAFKAELVLLQEKYSKQKDLVRQKRRDSKQLSNFANEVEQTKKAYEKACESTIELQNKVEAITNEINVKTTSKLSVVNGKISAAESDIKKLVKEIAKLEVEIRTADRNLAKSKQTVLRLRNEIFAAESSLKEKEQCRNLIKKDALDLQSCSEGLNDQFAVVNENFKKEKEAVKKMKEKQQKAKSDLIEADQHYSEIKEKVEQIKAVQNQWQHKLSSLKLHELPDVKTETLPTLTNEELVSTDLRRIEKDLHAHELGMKELKPDISIIQDYKLKMQFYNERTAEADAIANDRKKMKEHYNNLRTRRKDEFLNAYNIIKSKFQEMYRMITLGEGDADFELVDTFDPFSEGVVLNVRPPKKTWKIITNLSGGEKTLTSLALVFGLHYYKPSPLYVMDEIDAALDFKNVSIVANYVKERTKNAQFIIISLRSYTFELANHLVGIYKTYDETKSLVINPQVLEEVMKDDQENIDPNSLNIEARAI